MRVPTPVPDAAVEEAWIEGALQRDPRAVQAITTAYNRRLYRIARSILRNDDEAEDAVQAAYLRAFAALPAFRRQSSLGTWLTRILINEALGRTRSRRPTVPYGEHGVARAGADIIPFPGASVQVDPERAMAQRQIQGLLEEAIDGLPEAFRAVLVARILEEMSVEETAELLGLRPETVKTRLHRARVLLRRAMERRMGPVLMDAFPFDGWRCERMTRSVLAALGLPPPHDGPEVGPIDAPRR